MPANLTTINWSWPSPLGLFDFEEENAEFDENDPRSYERLQLSRLNQPAAQGAAFKLVKKLLAFNTPSAHKVEVVILSRNDPVTGLRVFKSSEHHELPITRGVFLRGRPPYGYLSPLKPICSYPPIRRRAPGARNRLSAARICQTPAPQSLTRMRYALRSTRTPFVQR
jgi:hypothetical protein